MRIDGGVGDDVVWGSAGHYRVPVAVFYEFEVGFRHCRGDVLPEPWIVLWYLDLVCRIRVRYFFPAGFGRGQLAFKVGPLTHSRTS